MGDLDGSPLFDVRHLQVIDSVLASRPLNPLSGIEQAFIKWGPVIREIDSNLYHGSFSRRLRAYMNYVSPADAVQFLVEAHKRGVGEDAKAVLEATVEEHRGGTLKELIKILQESRTGMPAEWAVTIHGETTKDRHAPPPDLPSGLNLQAMRDFK